MKRILLSLFSLILIASVSFGAGTAFERIAFQGYLTDANGDALSGSHVLTLTIYDATTGGSVLFTENQTITVTNGVFSLLIGAGGGTALSSYATGDIQYLGVKVDGDTELSPRTPLVSVPYAYTAKNVTGESVYVKNTSGTALSVNGKIAMDTGHDYSCAGSGTIEAGTNSKTIYAPVTFDSLIFLTAYSAYAHANGGIRVSAIGVSPPMFIVSTMDGNNVEASTYIRFSYLIIN